jgi:hypothetical protein
MKPTLTKQTTHELSAIARTINDREETIQCQRTKLESECNGIVLLAIEQGQALQQAWLRLRKTGDWELWLSSNVRVKRHMARNYMRLASNVERVQQAQSIRQALTLLTEGESANTDKKPERELLPYLEALGRISKLRTYIVKHPASTWPVEGLEKAREDLEPIARELWPERF